jgi:hypothetical protein
MVVSTEELLDIASEAGYRNISTELIAEWVEIGLLDSPTQVNSGAGNGSVSRSFSAIADLQIVHGERRCTSQFAGGCVDVLG